jgi:type 1 glutamine amidotransferase
MFGPRTRAAQGYQPYSRDKLRVLLSVDSSKFKGKGGARPDNDYAISWIREYGKGRVFYCALGHGEAMYMHPDMLKHYLAGLQYVLGDLRADATPSAAAKAPATPK